MNHDIAVGPSALLAVPFQDQLEDCFTLTHIWHLYLQLDCEPAERGSKHSRNRSLLNNLFLRSKPAEGLPRTSILHINCL